MQDRCLVAFIDLCAMDIRSTKHSLASRVICLNFEIPWAHANKSTESVGRGHRFLRSHILLVAAVTRCSGDTVNQAITCFGHDMPDLWDTRDSGKLTQLIHIIALKRCHARLALCRFYYMCGPGSFILFSCNASGKPGMFVQVWVRIWIRNTVLLHGASFRNMFVWFIDSSPT